MSVSKQNKRIIVVVIFLIGLLGLASFGLHSMPPLIKRPAKEKSSLTGDYLSGYYAIKSNNMDRASALFEKTLREQPNNIKLLKSAYLTTLLSGNIEKAVEIARKYSKGKEVAVTGYMVLAVEAIYKSNYLLAEKYLTDQAKSSNGTEGGIIPFMLSWCKVGQGKYAEAIAQLETLRRQGKENSFYWYQVALIQDLAGNNKEAEAAYEQLLDNEETSYRYLKAIGNFYERIGKTDKARKIYLSYLNKEPLSDLFRNDLARLDRKKQVTPSRTVTDAEHGAIEVLLEIASSLYKVQMLHESQAYLQMILFLDPTFTHAHVLLAATYEDTEQYELAIGHYENITPDTDFYRQAQINIAQNYYKLDKPGIAKERLVSLSREEKNDYLSLMALGELFRNESDFRSAAKTYSKVIESFKGEIKPYHWIVYYMRGINYERAGEWDKAEKDFLEALSIRPNQPDVMNYLGYSWLAMNKNPKEALTMIRKALDQRPDDAQILDSMGWALYMNNDSKAAVLYVERALEMMPADATINDHLGDIYWSLGREIEAKFQWQHALQASPDEKEVVKIKKKIEEGLPAVATPTLKQEETKATDNAKSK